MALVNWFDCGVAIKDLDVLIGAGFAIRLLGAARDFGLEFISALNEAWTNRNQTDMPDRETPRTFLQGIAKSA